MKDRITHIMLDIDGVITDGTVTLNRGEKVISFQDLDAVNLAKREGFQVALVTAEDSRAVDAVSERFGIARVVRNAKDKKAAIVSLVSELGISLDQVCYIGDSDRDAPALSTVGLGLAPANATDAAKSAAHRVLSRSGGRGAIAEAVSLLVQLNTSNADGFEESMRRIVKDCMAAHQRLLADSLPVLAQVAQVFVKTIRSGRKILLFGNGGSAADAQHVAGELVGRFLRDREPWPVIALTTNTSILTAVSNDWGFSDVFVRQVRALAQPGDVVVGISTSGGSLNVLCGLQAGRERGATTIGFTGASGGDMHAYTDICFCAPHNSPPRIQELHILAWHAICEIVETELIRKA